MKQKYTDGPETMRLLERAILHWNNARYTCTETRSEWAYGEFDVMYEFERIYGDAWRFEHPYLTFRGFHNIIQFIHYTGSARVEFRG